MTSPGRSLLAELVGDQLVSTVSDRDLLFLAGVESADLVRLCLAVEERLGRRLSADAAESLRTIAGVDAVLAGTGEQRAGLPAPA